MAKTHVTSVAEWFLLPELVLPTLRAESERGSTYRFRKVGFVIVQPEDAAIAPREAGALGDHKVLPTAVVIPTSRAGEDEVLCRLPVGLTSWVTACVEMAHAGMNPFPCDVEVGVLNGRPYAEVT